MRRKKGIYHLDLEYSSPAPKYTHTILYWLTYGLHSKYQGVLSYVWRENSIIIRSAFYVWFYHWLATRPWVNCFQHLGSLRFHIWDIKGLRLLEITISNAALKTIGSVPDQCFSDLSGHNGLRSWFSFFFFNAESRDLESLRQNLWHWGQGVTYVLKAYGDVNDQTGSGAIRLRASSGCFPDFCYWIDYMSLKR